VIEKARANAPGERAGSESEGEGEDQTVNSKFFPIRSEKSLK
jgi:hypothetical protein